MGGKCEAGAIASTDTRLTFPTLTWPRQIPVEGEPADVTEIVSSYAEWLAKSTVPKLFLNGEPGAALTGAQGYTGSKRSIERIVAQFRPNGIKPVSRQTITQGKVPSARSVALMMVRPPEHRTNEQIAFIEQLCQRDSTVATAFTLVQAFGQLLRHQEGVQRLEHTYS